jgi:hypothetical protein
MRSIGGAPALTITSTLTSAQASSALSFEATLDSYTNDSTSATC